ncbi:MAG: restriction endonuclease subunit S [Thermodesulfovibrionales bacterium]
MKVEKNNMLPQGWSKIPVRDIAQIIRGVSYGKGDASETPKEGYLPILRATNIQNNKLFFDCDLVYVPPRVVSEKQKLKVGDIVVATSSGSKHLVGKTAQLKTEWTGSFGVFCAVIRPFATLEPRYLGYFFDSPVYKSYISKKAIGVNINNLRRGDIEEILIPVAPLHDQKLIVSEIEKQFSRLDEAVAALKRVRASLKRYKAAVLKAAVEGKLVTSEQKKWKTTTVGEVSEVVTKGSSPNWQGFEYSSEGVVFVRSQNVSWGHLDLSDVAHLPLAFNKKEKKSVLRTGDVLLNIVGASIGRAAVATKSIEGGNINQAVAVIRPLRDRLLPQFLMCYFLSEKVQKLIHAQKVDVARANYSLDQIRKLPLHLPPLDDQHRIVEEIESRLSVAEEIEQTININLKRAERLRQAILKKAFSGRLVS